MTPTPDTQSTLTKAGSQPAFRSVFIKLFASVMLALTLFAIAMVLLTQLVQDKDATVRSQVLATQILSQIEPFLADLNEASQKNNRLQARFMLAVIKKSFDIFDESLQAKMGLYDSQGHLLMQTDNSDLPLQLPERPSLTERIFPVFSDTPQTQAQAHSITGYVLLFESRLPAKKSELSSALNLFTGTLLLLCFMAGVLWWIARSITWRINQLSLQMRQLGDGDFSARVKIKGNDEIAMLGKGFNQAAQKIEHLINANNLLLAHASHELRTPITRIRLQIEMMDMLTAQLDPKTKAMFDKRATAINRDLTGLNDLVESILLVSRLDAGHALQQVERLDLYDLVNQECQHYSEATLMGEHVVIDGQPQLLTHLIRNLLNNAMLHGKPPITVMIYGVQSIEDSPNVPEGLIESLIAHELVNRLTVNKKLAQNTAAKTTPLLTTHSEVKNNTVENSNVENKTVKNSNAFATQFDDNDVSKANNTAHSSASNLCTQTLTANKELSTDNEVKNKQVKNTGDSTTKLSTQKHSGDATLNLNDEHHLESQENDEQEELASNRKENPFIKRLRKAKTESPRPEVRFVVLAVIDEGNGIPKDKREEIFSPFVRLQQNKKGSGLGLSLVSQIVTAHRGRITTDTVNGHTRFLVVLPVNEHYTALMPEKEPQYADE